jgi:hypothetical protein
MGQAHRDVERYREAAELTLEQLQWVISLLYRLGRSSIAEALDKNRKTIIERYGL